NGSGTGDGNGDGIADQLQKDVTSFLWNNNFTIPHYLTVANQAGWAQTHAITLPSNTATNIPASLSFPYGVLSIQLEAPASPAATPLSIVPEESSTPLQAAPLQIGMSLYTDILTPVNGYWVQDAKGNWVNIATNITTVNNHLKVDFTVTDGGAFDADGKVDGKILSVGALGYQTPTPAVGTPGDKDGDGIPDAVEPVVGTNPAIKDNDVLHRADLFAMQLYRDVLFREGDTGGIAYWSNQINSGTMTRAQVAASFMASPEFQSGIGGLTRLYFGAFDRLPDREGLAYWIAQEKTGVMLKDVSSAFVAGLEFQSTYG
ncbi:DUF4214 domain-containing protein, partial [Undibacterium sp. SXout7W]|uniref:DUF4214 domain-containing protein n=1 Tax=Undibacterium sp. SXout7W TaxID=3413049 RepID=UPI003BF397DF